MQGSYQLLENCATYGPPSSSEGMHNSEGGELEAYPSSTSSYSYPHNFYISEDAGDAGAAEQHAYATGASAAFSAPSNYNSSTSSIIAPPPGLGGEQQQQQMQVVMMAVPVMPGGQYAMPAVPMMMHNVLLPFGYQGYNYPTSAVEEQGENAKGESHGGFAANDVQTPDQTYSVFDTATEHQAASSSVEQFDAGTSSSGMRAQHQANLLQSPTRNVDKRTASWESPLKYTPGSGLKQKQNSGESSGKGSPHRGKAGNMKGGKGYGSITDFAGERKHSECNFMQHEHHQLAASKGTKGAFRQQFTTGLQEYSYGYNGKGGHGKGVNVNPVNNTANNYNGHAAQKHGYNNSQRSVVQWQQQQTLSQRQNANWTNAIMSPLKTAKHAEQNPHQSTGNHRAAVAQMKTENFRAALAGNKMMVISKTKELEEKAFAFLAMRKQENQIRANARRLYPRGEETARVTTTRGESHCVNPVCRSLLPYHCSGIWSVFCRNCVNLFAGTRIKRGEVTEEQFDSLESCCLPVWANVYDELREKIEGLPEAVSSSTGNDETHATAEASESKEVGHAHTADSKGDKCAEDETVVLEFKKRFPFLFKVPKRTVDAAPRHYLAVVTDVSAFTFTVQMTQLTNEKYEALSRRQLAEVPSLPSVVCARYPVYQNLTEGERICCDLVANPMVDERVRYTLKVQHARTFRA
eukprot:g7104.t1